MDTIRLYAEVLAALEEAFHEIEARVDPPEPREFAFGTAYRYRTRSIEAAVIQKLARVVSGLNACRALLEKGLVQEVSVLQRTLDEFCEDIFFLCQPLVGGERTELHDQYLDYFYREEIDSHGNPFLSEQKRPQIPRSKIQAAIARSTEAFLNRSDATELMRSLSKAFGGFVHGASPQIMEMYGGAAPRYHVSGMLGTPRIREVTDSLWDYLHRGINHAALVAFALGDRTAANRLLELRGHFERASGRSLSGEVSEVMKTVKSMKQEDS